MWNIYPVVIQMSLLSSVYCYPQGPDGEERRTRQIKALQTHPDTFLTVPEIVSKYGYPVENHTVQTEDGYILTMYRIPYGKKSPAGPNKPVVLLLHGITTNSDCWVFTGPDRSLAFILADTGYDVWMADSRGAKYSRNHVTLSTTDPKFWNFTWHEMGVYDLPAEIDYILAMTRQKKLFAIGHSMGCTIMYVLGSMKPEYNKKFTAMIGFAPAAWLVHIKSPIRLMGRFVNNIERYAKMFGVYQLEPIDMHSHRLLHYLCSEEYSTLALCVSVLSHIAGYGSNRFNATELGMYLGHYPAGFGFKAGVHYMQQMKSGKFRQFDYGTIENIEHYGQKTPPDYDVRKITAPQVIYYSTADSLVHPLDVDTLYNLFPNKKSKFHIKNFNHFDFIVGTDVKKLLYDGMISLMKRL